MLDFGLSKKYVISDNKHIKFKSGKGLTGTARYASINTHDGIEQSRRDDLESFFYVLIYFIKGHLPWQNIKAKDLKEKYEKIKEKKKSILDEELCYGLPEEFLIALKYIKMLEFTQQPDYFYLRSIFKQLFKKNHFIYDFEFDWLNYFRTKNKIFSHTSE